ncbi:MAG: nitroreductase family protein [Chloroflexi bacterium]|nr:nitroreductase family protein [Chloroflexota bacterium]
MTSTPTTSPEDAAERLPMPLGEALYTLRAIRRFRPEPLPDAELRTILEAATRAPSCGNSQGWRFVVVRERAQIEAFAPLYLEAWWAKRAEVGIHSVADFPAGHPVMPQAHRLAEGFATVPAMVLLCATERGPDAASCIVPAAQNLLLAARALGIGGTITTLHPVIEERLHALFGIPAEAQLVYCIPLGYPAAAFGTVRRRPLAEVVAEGRWDAPAPWSEGPSA